MLNKHTLRFIMHQRSFSWLKLWTEGRWAQQPDSSGVIIDAVFGLAWSCWIMQGRPCKRHCLDGSKCCSKTWKYLSALMTHLQCVRWHKCTPLTAGMQAFKPRSDYMLELFLPFELNTCTSLLLRDSASMGCWRCSTHTLLVLLPFILLKTNLSSRTI